jgi:hypothetical protein
LANATIGTHLENKKRDKKMKDKKKKDKKYKKKGEEEEDDEEDLVQHNTWPMGEGWWQRRKYWRVRSNGAKWVFQLN